MLSEKIINKLKELLSEKDVIDLMLFTEGKIIDDIILRIKKDCGDLREDYYSDRDIYYGVKNTLISELSIFV